MSLVYQPPPTIERFMMSEALVRCVVGPVGSGKSMGMIMELFRRASQQAPSTGSNIRHTRFAIVRNTLQQLRVTVLTDIQQYLQPMISYFVTDSTIRIRAPLADGTVVHSDWLMIPLDTVDDQRRLLSTQLTGAWVNECREVPIPILSALIGRLGRYPSKLMGGPSWFGCILDTNPWDTDSAYHERFVLSPTPSWQLFHQPSGIGPAAENAENLPPNYYENLMSGRDEDWSAVHVESAWGTSNAGQAVFRRSFHVPTHVRDIEAAVNPHRPVLIAMDFGRTPTALICQVDTMGRLIVFEEVVTQDQGLYQMVEEALKPKLLADPYAGKRAFVVADPAGSQRSQLSEQNAFDVLRELGLLAYPAPSNAIGPRLTAVERMLRSTIMGEPALQISRQGCPQLVRALANTYRYRRRRDGQFDDVPEKLHPASDLADCLQYGCMAVAANLTGRVISRDRPRAANKNPVSAAGWT